jgi:ABC-2 type transport system permease protein
MTGAGRLLTLALRRDRIMLPVWLYALLAYSAGSAYASRKAFDNAEALRGFATGVNKNPALIALYGRVYDVGSLSAVSVAKPIGPGAGFVALMSLLLVVRHTRADEETGRLELVRSGVVGRSAALTAGLGTALIANLLLAVLTAAGLVVAGQQFAGSVAFALGWLGVGVVFTGVAAVTAQLTESGRTANALAIAVLGVCYLVRATGDAASGASWLGWLSPFGWAQRMRPYAGESWWPVAAFVVLAAVLSYAAFALERRRDLGAGLVPPRPGPAVGGLRGSFGLAWRLQRGMLLAWIAWFVVYGGAIGSVADSIGDVIGGSKATRDIITKIGGQQDAVDAFLVTAMNMMALFASAYVVQTVLRMRSEESAQRAEPILATAVGRVRWAAGHYALAILGPAVLLGIEGVELGLIHGARVHDLSGQLPRLVAAAFVQLPAVWLLAGCTLLLFGLAPRAAVAAWGVLGAFLMLGQLGPVLKLKQWAMDVSPFTHVPKLPGGEARLAPVVWLTVVAALLTAAGLVGLHRRDIG